jgi:predicted phage terminase large subunit-like protein
MTWRLSWLETARPKQIPPWQRLDWNVWLALAGRGFGKTRVGAEETGFNACAVAETRSAVVAPTQNDVRSVCFEGDSGLLRVIPKRFIRSYNSQALEIHLTNKSIIQGFSAEKPDRLRGPQFHNGWGDEVASWGASAGKAGSNNNRLQDTWDNLNFCLRLGQRPRLILTTTPRPIDFLRKLVKDPTTITVTGSTFENTKLAPSALETFKRIYEGTRRGRQELYAEILEQAEGALWNVALIEPFRVEDYDGRHVMLRDGTRVEIERIVVAIDPAVTTNEQSDETGIIVAGLGADGRIYVLDDASGKYSPRQWARTAMSLDERYKADCIVAEVNQGGDLVTEVLRAEAGQDNLARIKTVNAKRGKYLRAEPIAAYYEKGLVSHAGYFGPLEKQMLNFQGFTGENSPDRLDALVYAIGELMLGTVSHAFW